MRGFARLVPDKPALDVKPSFTQDHFQEGRPLPVNEYSYVFIMLAYRGWNCIGVHNAD
jgi:hypothetical protein